LIKIKAAGLTFRNAGIDEPHGVRTMPTEIIVIALVISVFYTFAGGLYWGDLRRRTKATLIYRRTGNLRATQLWLGHTKIESTVRYLGIEVDDAIAMAEQVDV
jgi:hypothetical protein